MRNVQLPWWDPHGWTQPRALRREEWATGTPHEAMLLVADRRIPLIAGFIAGAGVFAGLFAVIMILIAIWPIMVMLFTLNLVGVVSLVLSHTFGWVSILMALWPALLISGFLGTAKAGLNLRRVERRLLPVPVHSAWDTLPGFLLSLIGVPLLFLGLAFWKEFPIMVVYLLPAWLLSGLLYDQYWQGWFEGMLQAWLGSAVWFRRTLSLSYVLHNDSELFGCIFADLAVSEDGHKAHIQGWFRTPDQTKRARQVARRVVGIREVEVETLSWDLQDEMWDEYTATGVRSFVV
ncbi:MAG: hypothetical protein OXQ27_05660 [Chloroflexota bacterium]|nr:hypothetical protein [Chloroflexota bacterium]